MKFLKEHIDEHVSMLSEGKDGDGNLYLQGVFLQSAIKNRNGRIYPESIMDKEVARYVREHIGNSKAKGELGHPDTPRINLERVSHRIVELKKDGTNYIGKALILDTPMGNTARGMIEGGLKLGVSSRALGSLKPNRNGIMEVQGDFTLSTAADIVDEPSAPDAFVNALVEEQEWIIVDGHYMREDAARARRNIHRTPRSRLDEQKRREYAVWKWLMNKTAVY